MATSTSRTIVLLLTAVAVIYTRFPVVWMLSTSFKLRIDLISFPVTWITTRPTLQNYEQAFIERPFLQYMWNSLVVATAVTIISMAFGTLAGYSLARFRFPGDLKRHISFWILSTRMMPPIVTLAGCGKRSWPARVGRGSIACNLMATG